MREATNDYNGSWRILVSFPEFADAVAADFEQRPRAQAMLSPGRKYDAERLESAPDLPRRQRARARRSISKSSIVLPLTKRPMRALRPTSQAKRAPNGTGWWRISPR